jgi:hypothetical protein
MEQVPKKGMSKGCMVALIVGGVLLLLVIIAAVTCYMKREDLAKFGATTIVTSLKTELRQHPIETIDTARFFALSDAFAAKLRTDSLDYNKYSRFMTTVQSALADKKLDSAEVGMLEEAIVTYYPDLESMVRPAPQTAEPVAVPNDSAAPVLGDSGK